MGEIAPMMGEVLFTPLRRIPTAGGDVFHGMKSSDAGFHGFGEAYFSAVNAGFVKGWKRHTRMTLNFVVPVGCVQVSVVDELSLRQQIFFLGPEKAETYARLTIPPGYWVAFGGAAPNASLLLNLASIPHDPTESQTRAIDAFAWTWAAQP